MNKKRFIILSIFVLFIIGCIICFFYNYNSEKQNELILTNDMDFLKGEFNLTDMDMEYCVYTGAIVGNPRSIGPCDYEYFIFAKLGDEEIKRINETYEFEKVSPKFGISPTPSQKPMEGFTDKEILSFDDFDWGYSDEYEEYVMKGSTYIGEVYFDKRNGCIYMYACTT